MRTTGLFRAACEARLSLLHVDQLILHDVPIMEDTKTMKRITDRFWKVYVIMTNMSFDMFGIVVWRTRREEVYAADDDRKKSKHPRVEVVIPYVLPFRSYDLNVSVDEDHRLEFEVLDKRTAKPIPDVHISKCRRGGMRVDGGRITFDTDCGAVLAAWRRYRALQSLHDDVARANAQIVPFLEHIPLSEQVRLADSARRVETMQHPLDQFGIHQKEETVLKKIEAKPQQSEQTFVHVPPELRMSGVQPRPQISVDMNREMKELKDLYAATLQLPTRYVAQEPSNSLRGDSQAAVDEDVLRAVHAIGERRDEIVDVLREAYFACYGEADANVHLPTKKPLKVENLYTFHERGLMEDRVIKEEISAMTGIALNRFTKGPLRPVEEL